MTETERAGKSEATAKRWLDIAVMSEWSRLKEADHIVVREPVGILSLRCGVRAVKVVFAVASCRGGMERYSRRIVGGVMVLIGEVYCSSVEAIRLPE